MKALRNLLALVGLLTVAGAGVAIWHFSDIISRWNSFDEQAGAVYMDMAKQLLETGNAAEATVWKMPVNEGLSTAEVEEVMRFVANEHNIKNVGELPLSQQVEAMSGKPARYVKIYMFCNAMTAARMIAYSDAYSAYLPCRVTLLEDKQGKLWLYSLNMDLMIHGGQPLPAELKAEALQVKKIITDIMRRGAQGEF